MFVGADHAVAGAGAGAGFGRAAPRPRPTRVRSVAAPIPTAWATDLAAGIGSAAWWRGVALLTGLIGLAWLLGPALAPLPGAVPAPLAGDEREQARALVIGPLGSGARTGRRMAPTGLAVPIAAAPERPEQSLVATASEGDTLTDVLRRSGVGENDLAVTGALLGPDLSGQLAAGTPVDIKLGQRSDRGAARPLKRLSLRARFDLALTVARAGGRLSLIRRPIAIDRTPMRLRGLVGDGLYRSARAAGAPPAAVEAYIRALATRLSIGQDLAPSDRFDLVIARERAATGEVRMGPLMLAGLGRAAGAIDLVRWRRDGREDWYDADGKVERRGAFGLPVAGHITSGFGMRYHPLLGFTRMHKGIDIGAPVGTPVYSVLDGTVLSAGWSGGYGNFIRLGHGTGVATGYGHLSRIAVTPGATVRRGQVIGYVGSTGLSTGPHLHWEVWRGGIAINPLSLSFDSVETLPDNDLPAIRAYVARLKAAAREG